MPMKIPAYWTAGGSPENVFGKQRINVYCFAGGLGYTNSDYQAKPKDCSCQLRG